MAATGIHIHDTDDSLEAKVFRQHYAQLVSTIQDPEALADGLFSQNVIGRGLLQDVQLDSLTKAKKSRKLLLAVQDQLIVNPSKFTEVVDVLQRDSTMKFTVDKLQDAYLLAKQPKLVDLETELRCVHGWVQLGLCLDLPKHTLEEIHAKYSSGVDALGMCKTKMLSLWLERCKNPTWSMLIAALQATGRWATAIKIAVKYGIKLPSTVLPKGKIPLQIENLALDTHKKENVTPLREEIERMNTELHQTEEDIRQHERELQLLQNELMSLKNQQNSMDRCTVLLLKDKQIEQLKLTNGRQKLQELELCVQQFDHSQSAVPEDVREKLHQTQESTASIEHEFTQLESKIKSVQKTTSIEITEQLQKISSQVDAIADELGDLQHQKKEQLQEVQKCEQELDTYLLGRITTTPSITEEAEAAYYNIMICAGRVEVKLRQSEVDEYERKLKEKEIKVDHLKQNLKQQEQNLQELEDQSRRASKFKVQPSSSAYSYAHMHMQCKNEIEEYGMEHRISKLHAENLEYRMLLAMVVSQKCAMETEMQALIQEVASLRTMQTVFQQEIEEPRPKARPKLVPRPEFRDAGSKLEKAPTHKAQEEPIIVKTRKLPLHIPHPPPLSSSDIVVIKKNALNMLEELGQGMFGPVLRATYHGPRGEIQDVAVKTIREDAMERGEQEFMQEARIMVTLNHPYIVRVIGITRGKPMMLVHELVPLGTMMDYLNSGKFPHPNITTLKLWAAEIASGMMYLEVKRIVHRSLSAKNVLVMTGRLVKITGFRLSKAVDANSDYYIAQEGGKWPVRWYPPECMNEGIFSHASDVWSYGITLWEMFSYGKFPYGELTGREVMDMIMNKHYILERPAGCPVSVYQLMLSCWALEPSKRCTFTQLHKALCEEHEYISSCEEL